MEAWRNIELTKGQFAIVDAEDYERASALKWYFQPHKSGGGYAARVEWNGGDRYLVLLHRFILNAPAEILVDHKDGNKLDCRRSNLRIATSQQNNQNKKRHKNALGRYKGIWKMSKNRWAASITVDGVKKHLGSFASQEDAAMAYDSAAKRFFGEFAKLNFYGE